MLVYLTCIHVGLMSGGRSFGPTLFLIKKVWSRVKLTCHGPEAGHMTGGAKTAYLVAKLILSYTLAKAPSQELA